MALRQLLHGFDKSSRLVELQSQSDPDHLKRKKLVAVFCGSGEPCKLCTTLRVLTTLGSPGILTSIATPLSSPMQMDSKKCEVQSIR